MTYRPIQPVIAVLDNKHLPTPVRPAAAKWRASDDALINAELRVTEAQNFRREAQEIDRKAVEAAALSGGEPVAPDANQRRAEAELAAAEASLRPIEQVKVRAGETLVAALLEHRDELASMTQDRAGVALAAYEKALSDAEDAIRVAAAALTEATSGMGTLAELDGDPRYQYEIACKGREMTPPSFINSRREVETLRADIVDMVTPQNRLTVQTTDGTFIEFPRATALALVAEQGAHIVDRADLPPHEHVVTVGIPDW